MLIVVPSLDTGVCSTESKKFNDRLGELPEGIAAAVVSMDFRSRRRAGAAPRAISNSQMLSDYRDHSFGNNYGLRVKELGLLRARSSSSARTRTIRYVQIVPEIAQEPDYDEALKAAAAAA